MASRRLGERRACLVVPGLPAPTHGFSCRTSNASGIRTARDKFISSHHMRGVPVKIYKAAPENCPDGKVIPCAPEDGTEIIYDALRPAPEGMAAELRDSKKGGVRL